MSTTPTKKNTPAATGVSNALRKANQMLPERTTEVSQTLDQHRTTINGVDMWELSELQSLITTVSRQSYTDCVLSALDHLGDETAHSYADDVTGDIYLDREVFQLITDALDAPQQVQDYFAPPAVSIRDRLGQVALTDQADDQSPFDRIRQVREDGTEFWSARDLMPLLGYHHRNAWQTFRSAVIDRAMSAARNQGADLGVLFTDVCEKTGGRPREDFHLSRFAAYLVAMNGDPNKPEVAAAQAYFAVKTREAETRPALDPANMSRLDILQLAIQSEQERLELETKVQELTPKAELYDELMDADGSYSFGATARILGFGRNIMMRELRRLGVLQGNNLPYRRYDHHFQVTPGTYTNPKTGDVVPTATTTVLPTGLPFLRRKLEGVEV